MGGLGQRSANVGSSDSLGLFSKLELISVNGGRGSFEVTGSAEGKEIEHKRWIFRQYIYDRGGKRLILIKKNYSTTESTFVYISVNSH